MDDMTNHSVVVELHTRSIESYLFVEAKETAADVAELPKCIS